MDAGFTRLDVQMKSKVPVPFQEQPSFATAAGLVTFLSYALPDVERINPMSARLLEAAISYLEEYATSAEAQEDLRQLS